MSRESEINIKIKLDENQVPELIEWTAEGSEKDKLNRSKAINLALWDEEENNTLRIDLWTKTMMVDEMKKFAAQNIITMADSFERSTGEKAIAEEIREFGKKIAIKTQYAWSQNNNEPINVVLGNEWYAGNLSYHLKSRPVWEGPVTNDKLNSLSKFMCIDNICIGYR